MGSIYALAESTIGQIKAELIKLHGRWRIDSTSLVA